MSDDSIKIELEYIKKAIDEMRESLKMNFVSKSNTLYNMIVTITLKKSGA